MLIMGIGTISASFPDVRRYPEPIGMTCLMQVFFKVTEGQQANPEWERKLESVSKKFGNFKDKALEWDREKGTTPTPADEPPQGGAPA